MRYFSLLFRQCCLLCLFHSCLFISSLKAQSWEEWRARVDSLAEKGRFADAFALTGSLIQRAEADSGKTSDAYIGSLTLAGEMAIQADKSKEAEPLLLQARSLLEQIGKTRTESYVDVIHDLSEVYRRTDRFAQGLAILEQERKLVLEMNGNQSDEYTDCLNSIGTVKMEAGDYESAEKVLLEAYSLSKQLGQKSTTLLYLLNNLGELYRNLEQYVQAEPYFEEAIALRKARFGTDHPTYIVALNNLTVLYQSMGNYQRAIELGNVVLSHCERITPQTQSHAYALSNLALTYQLAGHNEQQADTLFRQALVMLASKNGATSLDYIGVQNNQAALYYQESRLKEALPINEQLYQYIVKDRQHRLYPLYTFNLGKVYARMNRFAEADTLFRSSLQEQAKKAGRMSSSYIHYLGQYANSLRLQRRYTTAIDSLTTAQQLLESMLSYTQTTLTTQRRTAFQASQRLNDNLMLSIAVETYLHERSPKSAALAYQTALMVKGTVLNEYVKQAQFLNTTPDTVLRQAYKAWTATQKRVSIQYALPVSKRRQLDSLETKSEQLEKAVARRSAPFRQARQAISTTWQDVQKALQPTDAAVEFSQFKYHTGYRQLVDSTIYVAAVLRPGWAAPRLVPLTDEKKLAELLKQPVENQQPGKVALLRSKTQVLTNTGQLARGEALYAMLWQPLDSLLSGVRQVWVSPSGLVHTISLAALPLPESAPGRPLHCLADRYVLRQVGSTRSVAVVAGPTKPARTVLLLGGVDYGAKAGASAWPALPGTQQEVTAIGALWGASATVVTGQQATKTRLSIGTAIPPDVLHLATHSFFRANELITQTDPVLTKSGIVLAGANKPEADTTAGQPGMLSGLEFVDLNLAGTQLVVLSACETGLGDIRGSEGVFGLQRAVKMAGAKNLLMSLWPVPDGPTSQFMIAFYRNWKQPNATLHGAFAQTQKQFRQQYPPAIWAAFVLVE